MADETKSAPAASTAKSTVVLVREFIYEDKAYPAGTELSTELEWVKRCILPDGDDLAVSKEEFDLTQKLAAAQAARTAKAEKAAKE